MSKRMIEDYIPVDAISAQCVREKLGGHHLSRGQPRNLHLWWARRPLAACRAAVYATFAPPAEGADRGSAGPFFDDLCAWEGPVLPDRPAVRRAREVVSTAGEGGSPPVVLDMFGGGGAIPLEAQRLGAIPYSVDLNPVAHLIQLCTLKFPQQYGQRLRDAVATWGEEVIRRTQEDVGDLYPDIPVPEDGQLELGFKRGAKVMRPIAYIWTRTIPTPARGVEGHAPLVRQTWLQRKKGKWVALRPTVDGDRVRFDLVTSEAKTEAGAVAQWGFDPSNQSARGKSTCPFSGSTITANDAKAAGKAGAMGAQLMAACVMEAGSSRGKSFVDVPGGLLAEPAWTEIERRLAALPPGLSLPTEPLPEKLTGGMCSVYGLDTFGSLFTPRQALLLLTMCKHVREIHAAIRVEEDADFAAAVCAYLALLVGRTADRSSTLCRFHNKGLKTENTYARQALPMVWDFAEANPFGDASGDTRLALDFILQAIDHCAASGGTPAECHLGPAQRLPWAAESVDAVITDPPYYDNISYADLSDFFYVWHKRALGAVMPRLYASKVTPKKAEAVVAPHRQGGDKAASAAFYEDQMQQTFVEAHRVLKPDAPMVVVYAHKTTLGWSTLVDSMRRAGFQVTEAWPLATEMPDRAGQMQTASLASSIFLVARKRGAGGVGSFAEQVLPEMRRIIAERVRDLMDVGIGGADLVIAAVGAGLRPFTAFDVVELPNGDEYTSEAFLDQVQREVFETVLAAVFDAGEESLGSVDLNSRAYVLFRYQYAEAAVPFGDANVLAQGLGVELSGVGSLSDGPTALVEEKKGTVRLRTYDERGASPAVGKALHGAPPSQIDVLHRLLWLLENDRGKVPGFLASAPVDVGQLKLLANALKGRSLAREGESRTPEQNAVQRLLAQWSGLFSESSLFAR